MKELNEITRTRLTVLGVILGIIALIHVVVISCVMMTGPKPEKNARSDQETPAETPRKTCRAGSCCCFAAGPPRRSLPQTDNGGMVRKAFYL